MSFDLTPSEEKIQIRDAARAMLDTHYPLSRLQDGLAENMQHLIDFGTLILSLDEGDGGAGFDLTHEAVLHVELGRHAIDPSALAAVTGLRMAMTAGRDELADQIMSGACVVTFGWPRGGGLLLMSPQADHAVILGDQGLRLTQIGGVTPAPGLGHGRDMGRATGSDIANGHGDHLLALGLLASAQLLGCAIACRDLTVDYAKTREQFGRPIGGFQAIKHHCANMAIVVETLSAQLDMSAIALRDGHQDAGFQVAALAHLAPNLALRNARLAVQVHGGIGFSAEAHVHHFVKSAHMLKQILPRFEMLEYHAPLAPFTARG
jgi:alkylation response protein AidB-like acyl-CoA dehydrogenase